jgi:hypothetical protein
MGPKRAVIAFTSTCQASNNLRARLATMKDVDLDIYEVDYYKNKPIGRLFEINHLPSAIFLEHGMPIARAKSLFEMEDFFSIVDDVVMHGKNPFE